ncbi:MAG: protein kinase [Candidatus Obscuribacterales bacterium]|nr:protein kinase [Candidatus Obscuribacterales bacterium]
MREDELERVRLAEIKDDFTFEIVIDGRIYTSKERLGEGGMGIVYRVVDEQTGREFALKILKKSMLEDRANARRFEEITDAISALDHANLVSVYGGGTTDEGLPYLLMDYVPGQTLAKKLKDSGPLSTLFLIAILEKALSAVSYAHSRGIIHRDLKPGNIMISGDDLSPDVHVVDFGIARVLPSQATNREVYDLTDTQEIFGSPDYMSPEQCLGFCPDERSDIYSIGCLIYQCLIGHPPFVRTSPIATVVCQINQAPPVPEKMSGDPMFASLLSIALRCLEKEPKNRFSCLEDLLNELKLVREGKRLLAPQQAKPALSGVHAELAFSFLTLVALIAGCVTLTSDIGRFLFDEFHYVRLGLLLLLFCGSIYYPLRSYKTWIQVRSGFAWYPQWWSLFRTLPMALVSITGLMVAVCACFAPFLPAVVNTLLGIAIDASLLSLPLVLAAVVGGLAFLAGKRVSLISALKLWLLFSVLVSSAVFAVPGLTTGALTRTASIVADYARIFVAGADLYVLAGSINGDIYLYERAAEYYNWGNSPQKALALVDPLLSSPSPAANLDTLLICRAEAYKRLGRFKEAMADIDRAIGLKPNSPSAHNLRAELFEQEGDLEAAIGDYIITGNNWSSGLNDVLDSIY